VLCEKLVVRFIILCRHLFSLLFECQTFVIYALRQRRHKSKSESVGDIYAPEDASRMEGCYRIRRGIQRKYLT
jgi:hypothetical protein